MRLHLTNLYQSFTTSTSSRPTGFAKKSAVHPSGPRLSSSSQATHQSRGSLAVQRVAASSERARRHVHDDATGTTLQLSTERLCNTLTVDDRPSIAPRCPTPRYKRQSHYLSHSRYRSIRLCKAAALYQPDALYKAFTLYKADAL